MNISRGDHTTRTPFAKNITRFSRGKHQNLAVWRGPGVSPGRRRRRKFCKSGAWGRIAGVVLTGHGGGPTEGAVLTGSVLTVLTEGPRAAAGFDALSPYVCTLGILHTYVC